MEIITLISLIYSILLGSALYFVGELFKRSDEVISYFKNVSFNRENQENDIKRILRIIGFLIQIIAIILVISQFFQFMMIIDN